MNFFSRAISALRSRACSRRFGAITAANEGGPRRSGWVGVRSTRNEDELNKEYLRSLGSLMERAQDLDVNNPDIGGFSRMRVAQIVGRGVRFKHDAQASEVGLDSAEVTKIAQEVNRLRHLHSKTGGFDATGNRRTENKQQERAVLTMLINGACLIHRVWRTDNPICPLSIELIPGVRISTPFDRAGDPLISYGIEYADEHRTRVAGYHVRRVSKTIGDSFVPDYAWDFVPVEDGVLLSLTEQAGLDRALPQCTRVARMARNRGEFIELSVEGARAQAKHYGVLKVSPKANAFDVAADDSDYVDDRGRGFTDLTDGVAMFYAQDGEELDFKSSQLPDPDFTGFMDKTDERMARGLVSSLSRFTRKVDSSYAGGRLEEQQDDPIIDQHREAFVAAWQVVNEWFLESLWLSDLIELPGYSAATRPYWTEFRATFPGKVHINPQDTYKAREAAYMLRSSDPFQGAEQDGVDARENLVRWGKYFKMQEEVEAEVGIKPHTLDILFSGKAMTSAAGADIAPEPPEAEHDPAVDGDGGRNPRSNGLRLSIGGIGRG